MKRDEAQSALDAVRDSDRRMADRMSWPLWRHGIFGAMMAAVLLAIAVPLIWQILIIGLVMVVVFFIVRDDKERHGMFVSGYQKGRTAWVLGAVSVFFIAAVIVTEMWIDQPLASPLFWSLEVALLVGSTALSVLWEKVYQADLRAGRA